jgi:hypothetical protein
MTRFRALLVAGLVALTFNFAGCFDHGGGDPCETGAAAGDLLTSGGTPC